MISSSSYPPKLILLFYLLIFLSLFYFLHSRFFLASLLAPTPFSSIYSTAFTLTSTYSGSSFFSRFNYESIPDPTHGYVNYVNRQEAERRNLTWVGAFDGVSYISVAREEKLEVGSWPGRKSIRLLSKDVYEEGTLVVIDVAHMPWGCGTWPAFWMTSTGRWPDNGEIDIIENVHLSTHVLHTLHTSSSCRLPPANTPSSPRHQTGLAKTDDCDVNASNQWTNEGCGVQVQSSSSYGRAFNEGGGGMVAMAWEKDGIKMWDWAKGDIPESLLVEEEEGTSGKRVETEDFGIPTAHFPFTHCSPDHFKAQHLIINIALCGDWAGQPAIWASSGCLGVLDPSDWTCERSVREGKGLEDAYWGIRSIRTYGIA